MDTGQCEYFSSYEDLEIHQLMLEDYSRTKTYQDVILGNKSYFQDKVVMDVGCGTGILSIFCAQAGAKKVYAIEASTIAHIAKKVVKENKFENIIEVFHSKVEDVELSDHIKVDAIVSEWMGFYLLHEGMLDSVLYARKKFLKDDGLMFPESATVYVAPCSVPSLYEKWNDIYGVSMSTFAKQLRESKHNKPEVLTVKPEDIIGQKEAVCWISLKETEISELDSFSIKHVVGSTRAGAMYQGLCLWFECKFPEFENGHCAVILDTSPESQPTHWKQTVVVLPQEQKVDLGEPIAFTLDINRDPTNKRRYNIEVTMEDPEEIEHPLPCTCDMTKCILIKSFMNKHDTICTNDDVSMTRMNIDKVIDEENDVNILQDDDIIDDDDC